MAHETDLVEGLFAHLHAMTLTPALPIAWPNVKFEPGAGQRYLRVSFMPTSTTGVGLADDSSNQHRAILQIDVMTPITTKGEGIKAPLDIAGQVASHFKRGTRLYRGSTRILIRRAVIEGAMVSGAHWMTPVSIYARAFAPNT
jgi:hypothetical protein